MKLFLAVVSLCLASGACAAEGATSSATSVEELSAKGVTFHRLQLQTPGASVEIETLVASGRAVGQYQFTECIVLKDGLSTDQLVAVDSAPSGATVFARRSKSAKPRSVFLVRGNEIPKAYLAFEFSGSGDSGTGTVHRYLLPVSAIKRARANPAPETPTPVDAHPNRSGSWLMMEVR